MSEYVIEDLSMSDIEYIDEKLDEYDQNYIKYQMKGSINIGIKIDGRLIAGLNAYQVN